MINSWQNALKSILENNPSLKDGVNKRISLVGIGAEFNGDDAAGVVAARLISSTLNGSAPDHLMVIDAGQFPENITGSLRAFSPDIIIFIDAVQMNADPGQISWIPLDSVSGMSASSHSMPLSVLSSYLRLDLNCDVHLLGIQPAQNEPFQPLNSQVLSAVEEISDFFLAACR